MISSGDAAGRFRGRGLPPFLLHSDATPLSSLALAATMFTLLLMHAITCTVPSTSAGIAWYLLRLLLLSFRCTGYFCRLAVEIAGGSAEVCRRAVGTAFSWESLRSLDTRCIPRGVCHSSSILEEKALQPVVPVSTVLTQSSLKARKSTILELLWGHLSSRRCFRSLRRDREMWLAMSADLSQLPII